MSKSVELPLEAMQISSLVKYCQNQNQTRLTKYWCSRFQHN